MSIFGGKSGNGWWDALDGADVTVYALTDEECERLWNSASNARTDAERRDAIRDAIHEAARRRGVKWAARKTP